MRKFQSASKPQIKKILKFYCTPLYKNEIKFYGWKDNDVLTLFVRKSIYKTNKGIYHINKGIYKINKRIQNKLCLAIVCLSAVAIRELSTVLSK